jgi:uncharacterized membrane protein HdeD (DUF308 family)
VRRVIPDDIDAGENSFKDEVADEKSRSATISVFDEMRIAMNTLLEQKLWKWKLVAGLLTVVLGGIVLAWPGPTILVVSTLFGVYLLLTGFAELFLAFTLPRSTATRVLLFISGALSLIFAVLSFRHFGDAHAVLLLSLWIGIGFIIQGVSEVAVSIGEQNLSGRGWYAVLGIISVIAGFVFLFGRSIRSPCLCWLPACGLSLSAWSRPFRRSKSARMQRPCEKGSTLCPSG